MGNMKCPSKEVVESLRKEYPPGTRIVLLKMDDKWAKQKPGDRATVEHIDSMGTIFCRWDCGSGLGLALDEDEYRKLTPEELAEEQAQEMTEPEQENGGIEMGM